MEDKGCVEELMRDPGGSLLVTEIMLAAEGGTCVSPKSLEAQKTQGLFRQTSQKQ